MDTFTFSSLFSESLEFFKKYLTVFALLSLLLVSLPQVLSFSLFLYLVVSMLCSILLSICVLMLMPRKDKSVTFSDVLSRGLSMYGTYFVFVFVVTFFLFFLFLALIIPGIIFSIFWMLAPYIYLYEKKSITESLRLSKKRLNGKWWLSFGYMCLLILIYIGVMIAVGVVLSPFTIMAGIDPLSEPEFSTLTVLVNAVGSFFNGLMSVFIVIFGYFYYVALSNQKTSTKKKTKMSTKKKR